MPIPEDKAKDIVNVAAQIARAQGGEPEATVLGNCIASLIFDGEDYDVSLYTLTLEVPVQTYANIEQYREGSNSPSEIAYDRLRADTLTVESGKSLSRRSYRPRPARQRKLRNNCNNLKIRHRSGRLASSACSSATQIRTNFPPTI